MSDTKIEVVSVYANGIEFVVPVELNNDTEMVSLILKTESMLNDEKQYWFDIWHTMNDEQRDRLRDILAIEKAKLEELDANYQAEIASLNKKNSK